MNKAKKISCSIVGARGYAGLETARLLLSHPAAELTACFATQAFKLGPLLGEKKVESIACLADSELMGHLTDVVFLATPAEVSMDLAPKILAKNKKVIDLSGAFRLKKSSYLEWYGFEHTQEEFRKSAHYGLVPWATGEVPTNLVANPGCYATSVLMALIPLLKSKLIDPSVIAIDAKSGSTGAGKKASENLLFTEVDGECLPYKIGKHQHLPEIIEGVETFAGHRIDPHFTTSLLPVRRGIITSIFATLREGTSKEDVEAVYRSAYGDYSLVSVADAEEVPSLLSLRKVVGTGKTHISFVIKGRKLYVFSAIDNLLKGAAGQAIENFNRLHKLPIGTGLEHLEVMI